MSVRRGWGSPVGFGGMTSGVQRRRWFEQRIPASSDKCISWVLVAAVQMCMRDEGDVGQCELHPQIRQNVPKQ